MRNSLIFLILFSSQIAFGDLVGRPNGHAPIGVMADHGHKYGEWMLSYRLMYMGMKDLKDGVNSTSASDTFSSTSYMMAPKTMTMWMHMVGIMYGVSDKVTLSLMLPYLSNSMTVARKMQGDEISMESSGIGDISLNSIVTLSEDEAHRFITTLGFFAPTGSIEQDKNGSRLGYPMQTGSGSYALQPALVYTKFWQNFSVGIQQGIKLYVGRNDAEYRRGSNYFVNIWGSYELSQNFSGSVRLAHNAVDPIIGSDSNLNAMMAPPNNSRLQHGNTTVIHLGGNWLGTSFAHGHRVAFEVGMPVYQDLSGPQMKTGVIGMLGWQKAF